MRAIGKNFCIKKNSNLIAMKTLEDVEESPRIFFFYMVSEKYGKKYAFEIGKDLFNIKKPEIEGYIERFDELMQIRHKANNKIFYRYRAKLNLINNYLAK